MNRKKHLNDGYLEDLLNHLKNSGADHIAITGDLVNLSLEEEFTRARDFLNALGEPENVSVVCGNHDAYVPGALRKAIDEWQPYISGDDNLTTSNEAFPYLRIRGDVAIIGCNSAEATAPFKATGYFRKPQAKRLAKILEQTKNLIRVILIHHPPFANATKKYKRLIGLELFQEVVAENGADLILHGHTHLATNTSIPGYKDDIPVICVPAAGNSAKEKYPTGQYNLFHIEKHGNKTSIQWQIFGRSETERKISLLGETKLQ